MKAQIMEKDELETVDLNRRKAIHERCINCSGWFTKDVRDCNFTKCPLHPFKTGKGKQNSMARNKAILEYCRRCSNGQVGEVTKCPSKNCPLHIYRNGQVNKNKPTFEIVDQIGDTIIVSICD